MSEADPVQRRNFFAAFSRSLHASANENQQPEQQIPSSSVSAENQEVKEHGEDPYKGQNPPSGEGETSSASGVTRNVGYDLEEEGAALGHDIPNGPRITSKSLLVGLGLLDRLLAPLILLCMIVGVAIGASTGDSVPKAFDTVQLRDVSVPIAIGLLVMMWPVLTKVQYECLPTIFKGRKVWIHIGISLVLNWILGPLIMLGLAWATLPDLPTYRAGVILVGLARCIAMVMIWNQLAGGDHNYCAILVALNSILQIILYAPYAVLFLDRIGGTAEIQVTYSDVAIDVLIYLGIPLVAGVVTRYAVWGIAGKPWFEGKFLPIFSPLALIGLLYTVLVMFAYQGHHILENIGNVFRVFVPMILYFVVMWTSAFGLVYFLSRRDPRRSFGYEMAVVQSFTAGSNNFELAIAIAIGVYGVGSDQALAATIGPLIEVPVLLSLTWVALQLKKRLNWHIEQTPVEEKPPSSREDNAI